MSDLKYSILAELLKDTIHSFLNHIKFAAIYWIMAGAEKLPLLH